MHQRMPLIMARTEVNTTQVFFYSYNGRMRGPSQSSKEHAVMTIGIAASPLLRSRLTPWRSCDDGILKLASCGTFAGTLVADACIGLHLPGSSTDGERLAVVPPMLLSAVMQAVHSGQSGLSPPVLQRLTALLSPLRVCPSIQKAGHHRLRCALQKWTSCQSHCIVSTNCIEGRYNCCFV